MTVVTFALPDESRDFLKRLAPGHSRHTGHLGGNPVGVVHVGVGDSKAQRDRLAKFLREEAPTARHLIISGFAGALRPGVAVGDLVLGENFTTPVLLNPARAALKGEPLHVGNLTTQATAAETASAKAALRAAAGDAVAVDMETAWVAAVGAEFGLSSLALRVISDAADQDFPVPGEVMFDPVRQRPRYLALPAYLVTHPACIGPFVRFVRGLGPARTRLAGALVKVIDSVDSP